MKKEFLGMPAPFLIEQDWALGGYKNKEGEGIQIGTLNVLQRKEAIA